MANISICSWTKRRQSRAKRIVFRAVGGGGVCLSLSLPFHMPYAIISQDVANKIRRKQRPKCNMLVKNEPTKDPSTRRMHTQILYTHIHMCVWKMCNRKPKNFQHWIFLFFLRFTFVLFCFVLAPRLRTRGQYEIEIAFGIWSADRQRIKIYLSSNSEPQIISVRCTRHFHFDCKRAQLIEFLGFISYVNDAPRKCGERPHSAVCVCVIKRRVCD